MAQTIGLFTKRATANSSRQPSRGQHRSINPGTAHRQESELKRRGRTKMAKTGRPMGKLHQDDVRAKIQTSQLVNRLTDHALGIIELSTTQVRAIEILIKKTLPDLSSIELRGDDDNPVNVVTRVELVPLVGNSAS